MAAVAAGVPADALAKPRSPEKHRSAAAKKKPEPPRRFRLREGEGFVETLWERELPGLITDLDVSRDGSAVVVATKPDPEGPESGGEHWVSRYDSRGRFQWRRRAGGPVKAQAVSGDGSLVLVTGYDERITAFDRYGKRIWEAQAPCRPFPLESVRRILCYFDDDARPETAFELLDWGGRKLASFPIRNDVLALKIAEDQRHFAVGLARGQILLFDSRGDTRALWQRKVDGEVVDLAVSSLEGSASGARSAGKRVRVAVLTRSRKPGKGPQKLWILSEGGETQFSLETGGSAEQVELVPDGSRAWLRGNSVGGQYLALASIPESPADAAPKGEAGSVPKITWQRAEPRNSSYDYPLLLAGSSAVFSFEGPDASHVLHFGRDGATQGELSLRRDEEVEDAAWLYWPALSEKKGLFIAGMDDGKLVALSFPFARK